MDFKKYQHIERIGTAEVNGIENGTCYIFPKIDGTNGSLWFDSQLKAGSRNRELSLDYDNQGFMEWAVKQDNFIRFFTDYPYLRLYGEWLVPHTLKTYRDDAWRNFYVFDVMDGERYVPYDVYNYLLDSYNIEYIVPICKIVNPSYERLVGQLDKNGYLIKDGCGSGEGIVVKNYNFVNKYGRTTWGKIVKNEFKTKHAKCETPELKEKKLVEQDIVDKYVTLALVEKEFSKIDNDCGWSSKSIPRLLHTVFYCLVSEECWNFVKDHKNPVVDFKRLNMFTVNKVKELKPELF